MINSISVKTRFGWISAFEKKDKIFTYKIEINANDTTRMCEYLHTHWTRVIKLDKVCLST